MHVCYVEFFTQVKSKCIRMGRCAYVGRVKIQSRVKAFVLFFGGVSTDFFPFECKNYDW